MLKEIKNYWQKKWMIEQPYRYLLKAILISFVLATIFYAVLNSEVACTDDGCSEFQTTISNQF